MYKWIVTSLTRRVQVVEQELLTLPEHLSSPRVFSGVRVTRSIFSFICMFCRSLFVLCTFSLVIALSILLQFTDYDYPFGIFKHFLKVFHFIKKTFNLHIAIEVKSCFHLLQLLDDRCPDKRNNVYITYCDQKKQYIFFIFYLLNTYNVYLH
jgi:hypothetical protein